MVSHGIVLILTGSVNPTGLEWRVTGL